MTLPSRVYAPAPPVRGIVRARYGRTRAGYPRLTVTAPDAMTARLVAASLVGDRPPYLLRDPLAPALSPCTVSLILLEA